MTTRITPLNAEPVTKEALREVAVALKALANRVIRHGGLAINAGSSPLARLTAVTYFLAFDPSSTTPDQPILRSIAAGALPALSGTVVNGTFNVFAVDTTAAGVTSVTMGTAGATLAAVKFPPLADGSLRLGFIAINPTGTGNFVGGTTALDDATVVPNTVYLDITGAAFIQPNVFEK